MTTMMRIAQALTQAPQAAGGFGTPTATPSAAPMTPAVSNPQPTAAPAPNPAAPQYLLPNGNFAPNMMPIPGMTHNEQAYRPPQMPDRMPIPGMTHNEMPGRQPTRPNLIPIPGMTHNEMIAPTGPVYQTQPYKPPAGMYGHKLV